MMRWLLARAEAVLNRHVGESTAAARIVDELDGRAFAIRVEGLGLGCVLRASGGRIVIADAGADTQADAAISGMPLDLLRLLGPDIASRLPGSAARLTGKVHVAERFGDALRLAMPDFEEELARWIGDVPAHGVGRVSRGAVAWATKAADSLRLDAAEYLQEESRALPAAVEVEAFYADVERLRDDVERAAERIERLGRRIDAA